jgi:hypothetical protein
MRSFFAARTEQIARELEIRAPFRKKYFADGCLWDSRSGSIERSENEIILEIENSGGEARVITQEKQPFPRLRYVLIPLEQTWQIRRVDVFVEGHGWMGEQDLGSKIMALRRSMASRKPSHDNSRL